MNGYVTGQSWWRTDEGLAHRDLLRSITTVHIGVVTEPRAKSSRANNKLKTQLLRGDEALHRPDGWPRPTADVALDARATTPSNTPPDVQNFCKWLLDELGQTNGDAVVYKDDRQVKMLFARVDKISKDGEPKIWVHAQRVSLVKEGLRRAIDVARDSENPDQLKEAMATPVWVYDGGDVEQWIELYEGDDSAFGRDQLLRARYAAQFQVQQTALAACDEFAAHVVLAYVAERTRAGAGLADTAEMLKRLICLPYTIDLGQLPTHGGGEAFRHSVRAALLAHAQAKALYFPLLHEVGLTVFYVESAVGKDLDNIFRIVVPIVLDVLKPPAESVSPIAEADTFALWDEVRHGRVAPPGPSSISFIQAVALTGIDTSRFPPGTVLLTLTPGNRHHSLWRSGLDTLAAS
jgi:hypothetical protein